MGKTPLCMDQHKRAFTTCRIPGEHGDELRVLEPSRDVIVVCCHRFYTIPAYDEEGRRICSRTLLSLLREVWAAAHAAPRLKHSVGLLTSEQRPVWAKARQQLLQTPVNAESLEAIAKALTLIVLEDDEPESDDHALKLICGGDPSNRFFDKVGRKNAKTNVKLSRF